jgi:hypothetical protein
MLNGICVVVNHSHPMDLLMVLLCDNPSFGLATKAKACKVASRKGSLGVTSHAPRV